MLNDAVRYWADLFGAEIAAHAGAIGRAMPASWLSLMDRSEALDLHQPGRHSANGSCRLVRSRDHWLAVNLARASDWELVPAWLGCAVGDWHGVEERASRRSGKALLRQARLLGLAVSRLGERVAPVAAIGHRRYAGRRRAGPPQRLRVVDMASLWAGPLCGAILAAAGAEVMKIESLTRPDTTRVSAPELDRRLNGAKTLMCYDFADSVAVDELAGLIAGADILITSARARAFEALSLTPERMFAVNPNMIWVAVSGYGWTGPGRDRIGFGDDAAVAGGLVETAADGTPAFIGDAAADPLTGLAAAAATLSAVRLGGGMLLDAALARTAAWCAARPMRS
jgi:hypothetical protein